MLHDVVTWCNSTVGFLSALLTLVYVIATLCLVLLGFLQLRAAFKLERARTRPVIILDLITEHAFVHVTLKNFGQTTARNIKVVTYPEIRTLHGGPNTMPAQERDEPIPFIANGVTMMPPQREIKSAVGFWPRFLSHYPQLRFSGYVAYRGSDQARYRDDFEIDLSAQRGVMHIERLGLHEVAEELKELARSIRHIATGFEKPLVRIIAEDAYRRREKKWAKRAMREAKRKGLFKDAVSKPAKEELDDPS